VSVTLPSLWLIILMMFSYTEILVSDSPIVKCWLGSIGTEKLLQTVPLESMIQVGCLSFNLKNIFYLVMHRRQSI
jgi:hypothetical protein